MGGVRVWVMVGGGGGGERGGREKRGVWLAAYLLFGFEITSALGPGIAGAYPDGHRSVRLRHRLRRHSVYLRDAVTLSDIGTYTLQILSGINFPVTALPRPLMIVGLTLPMTYAIDAIRALLIGTTPLVAIEVSLAIVLISMFVFLILGRVVFERIDTRVRKMGTLSTH